ncbi:MAG: elongation factor 4 [Erysipelothrix sp.]|nr:elongation factor 4 [Erysipelothrix sp.]
MKENNIRNFSIIAHIDHGKSTLADRLLESTQTVSQRDMQTQVLDSLDLERERGITIKLNAVQLKYKHTDGEDYVFHLIDTPGHVDFTYEVSRSLAACEGAILVVDATQGIEAQTLANAYLAIDNDLEIMVVINKIDLPSADPDRVKKEIEDVLGIDASNAPLISAKTGLNIDQVLKGIVEQLPPPTGDNEAPLKALIFDSIYDSYRGVIAYVRIKEGEVKPKDTIRFMNTGAEFEVLEVGIRNPNETQTDKLSAGDVGWISASIKSINEVHVGDTITLANNPAAEPLDGYRQLNPMVYCGLYPIDNSRYTDLREALEKMALNDASLTFEPETSQALGFGFRTGFLGLLHMDVVQERLEREFDFDLIATAPSVVFNVYKTNGEMVKIDNPAKMPEPNYIDRIEEPYVEATILVPNEFVGPVMELCQLKRGVYVDMQVIDESRMNIVYHLPLVEIVFDFFDKLKSATRGYASFDYEFKEYRESKLVKMDILLNSEVVDALSVIVHADFAYNRGNAITRRLRDIIPRQQFEVPVQAAINHKIIARTNIKAVRKNVIAKCYGGDITRKKKLLEKQKKGKKRMKAVGSVEIPQEAFMSVLSMDDD